jgi:hypothetical protein
MKSGIDRGFFALGRHFQTAGIESQVAVSDSRLRPYLPSTENRHGVFLGGFQTKMTG